MSDEIGVSGQRQGMHCFKVIFLIKSNLADVLVVSPWLIENVHKIIIRNIRHMNRLPQNRLMH